MVNKNPGFSYNIWGDFVGLLSPRNVLVKTKKASEHQAPILGGSWKGWKARSQPAITHEAIMKTCPFSLTKHYEEIFRKASVLFCLEKTFLLPSPCHIPSPWIVFLPSICSFVKLCYFCHKLEFVRCFWKHPV